MKLHFSNTSPFARKVLLTAIETNHVASIEVIDHMKTGTFVLPTDYEKKNPLFKIPAFELDNGEVMIDSPVICEYLSRTSRGRQIFPQAMDEYFFHKKLEAIADGATDAAVLRVYESRREPHLRSAKEDQKQKLKITESLKFLDQHVYRLTSPYLIGEIAMMCLLDYLDLRFPFENWRAENPQLAHWFSRAQTWEPYLQTTPNKPKN